MEIGDGDPHENPFIMKNSHIQRHESDMRGQLNNGKGRFQGLNVK